MFKLNVKAILIGTAIDIIGSTVFSILFMISIGITMGVLGVKPEQISKALSENAHSLRMLIVSMIIGFGFTMLGGYWAARIANRDEIRHAFAVGALSEVLGIVFVAFSSAKPFPLWYSAVSYALLIPVACLGGYFRMLSTERESHNTL